MGRTLAYSTNSSAIAVIALAAMSAAEEIAVLYFAKAATIETHVMVERHRIAQREYCGHGMMILFVPLYVAYRWLVVLLK